MNRTSDLLSALINWSIALSFMLASLLLLVLQINFKTSVINIHSLPIYFQNNSTQQIPLYPEDPSIKTVVAYFKPGDVAVYLYEGNKRIKKYLKYQGLRLATENKEVHKGLVFKGVFLELTICYTAQ